MYNLATQRYIFIKIPSILIVLIPFFLISGPLLSDLAVSICSILFLINCILNRNLIKYFKYKPFIVFIFFWLYLVVNSITVSEDIIFSLKNSFFYFRFGVFSLCVWHILENDNYLLKKIFYSIFICFFILIFDGFFQYYFKFNIIGFELHHGPRISSLFGDELVYGSYLSRLMPLFFAVIIFCSEKNYISKNLRYLSFLLFILADIAVFLSGERTAFFFINLAAIIFIFSSINYKKTRFFLFAASMFVIFLLSFVNLDAKKRIIDNTIYDMYKPSLEKYDNSKIYIFSKTHQEHIISAYRMFSDSPIFGVGHKNFRLLCSEDKYLISENSCSTHPHNIYFQLLSEHGIIGFSVVFSLFILILFIMIKHTIANFFSITKNLKYNDFQICLFIALIISLWPLAPSGNFFNNWISIIIFYPVGILIWSIKSKNSNS